jgi:pSer/pThr/pTyr-binding forkhead associated (FHA) protein
MAAAAEAADAGTEAPIAAFAVAKSGVVLKHIFLNGPPMEEPRRGGDGDVDPEEEDPPVLFGRHPDCHVLLDHPSISRRHLEVRCKRRQRRITVTDLSSGTD